MNRLPAEAQRRKENSHTARIGRYRLKYPALQIITWSEAPEIVDFPASAA
jgi:hypothetical protein